MVDIFDLGALVSGAGVGGVPLSAAVGSPLPHPGTDERMIIIVQHTKTLEITRKLQRGNLGNRKPAAG